MCTLASGSRVGSGVGRNRLRVGSCIGCNEFPASKKSLAWKSLASKLLAKVYIYVISDHKASIKTTRVTRIKYKFGMGELNAAMRGALIKPVFEEEEGNTRGWNDKLHGQIRVRTIALNERCTIRPPAGSEYAVKPVGVKMMGLSQMASVISCCLSTNMSIMFRCRPGPQWSKTSFRTGGMAPD